jgi:hypothetical protein
MFPTPTLPMDFKCSKIPRQVIATREGDWTSSRNIDEFYAIQIPQETMNGEILVFLGCPHQKPIFQGILKG